MLQKKTQIGTLMVSVVILDNGEPNVVQLTFDNLYKELKDIYGSELLIKDKWFDLSDIKNRYVCFVESDCLVDKGYFHSQLEKFMEKGYSRNMGIMSSATSVCYWDNKIYGYNINTSINRLLPNREAKSSSPFTVEVAYIPGAIIRVSMLKTILKDLEISSGNLVDLSSELSMAFWKRSAASEGKGYRIYLNPKTSYLTTEDYVNDITNPTSEVSAKVLSLFTKELI